MSPPGAAGGCGDAVPVAEKTFSFLKNLGLMTFFLKFELIMYVNVSPIPIKKEKKNTRNDERLKQLIFVEIKIYLLRK